MKNILLYLLLIICTLQACKKDDAHIFAESADERLNKALASYQTQLTGAQDGWRGVITPIDGGGAYGFYLKFNNQNRVTMYSDIDTVTASTAKESSYRLKALQQPSLIFDTYSYLHMLADPDPSVIGGTVGQGLRSDFEFYFASATADSIILVGRVNGSKLKLVKATKAEADAYNSGQLANSIRQLSNLGNILSYFKRLVIGGNQYDFNLNEFNHTITFTWVDNSGNIQTFTTGYYYTVNGIQFSTPFTRGTQTINGFTNITWNSGTGVLTVTSGSVTGTIVGVAAPIKIDVDAPRRWYQFALDQGSFWISIYGFHVNGVEDAYHVTALPGYNFMFYYPQFGSGFDWGGIVAATNYGPAFRATFTADGRVVFTTPGNFGTTPAAATATVAAVRTQYTDPNGYYLVQTSAESYDMVSAKDAKSWITWLW